jgi:hypothetical protein
MRRQAFTALFGLTLLAACAGQLPGFSASDLPSTPNSLRGTVTDPARSAIGNLSSVFGAPSRVAGQPVQVANAISQMEWLTVDLATNQRFTAMPPMVPGAMLEARNAVRQTFGVAPATTPQAAVTAFDGAAAALASGDGAAAEAAVATVTGQAGAARAVALLSNLPAIPQAANGVAAAANGLAQLDMGTQRFR